MFGIRSVGCNRCGAATLPAAAADYTTTPNKYMEYEGTRYAYRTIGERGDKLPLVLFQHFTGTMMIG